MHEAGFTEQIVKAIIAQVKEAPDIWPKRVKVKVGEIFHLNKEAVLFHYDMLARGTELEGIMVELEEEPVRVLCRHCGMEGGVEDHHLMLCSSCGSRDVEMIAGGSITAELITPDR
ncbi:MAG: hydrogenase maturation nickel metallochaperone HypA [Candidatus Omnitrophota bacterium]|nr:hydrogenase maturation nickel metallochaperone HypA [Candidatus Omnitrophota bacterium]MDZ4241415.1 hydrogenase maturation nickel metallochaperone HypA [Candidatus Omnitrophota bacterium]